MNLGNRSGWKQLLKDNPSFAGDNRYPIPAYSEFMPPPRIGVSPYREFEGSFFSEDDPFGWPVSEMEEEYELKPGFENEAQMLDHEAGSDANMFFSIARELTHGELCLPLKNSPFPPVSEEGGLRRLAADDFYEMFRFILRYNFPNAEER
jgi:hypothetical protein